MPADAERLLVLAHEVFCDLGPGEREVLRCAATGEEADLAPWGPQPAEGEKNRPGGGPLRAAFLEWLCTDSRVRRRVHRKGVYIKNATLDQYLDLECAEVPFSFGLHSCLLPGLNAARAKFGNNLDLRYCRIDGPLALIGAHIGGQLFCQGAHILGANGIAILADRADIGNSVFLSDNFLAMGAVRLLGAKITGQLNCQGGSFLNPNGRTLPADNADKGIALGADNADISNDVLLSDKFRAVGAVHLSGAHIGGQLNCQGGRFLNRNGNALILECASIQNALILEPRRVRGRIDLLRAKIETGLRMTAESTAAAELDLSGAKVGDLFDRTASWPTPGKLLLDGFQYDDIHHKSPRGATERLEWLGRMPRDKFLPQPYEQLTTWFQKTGHDSEAKDIRIAKEKARMRQWLTLGAFLQALVAYLGALWDEPSGQVEEIKKDGAQPDTAKKLWNLFLKGPFKRFWWRIKGITIGYGYRPQRAIVWLLGLILFGAIIYSTNIDLMTPSVSYNFQATEPTKTSASLQSSDYPDLNALFYSIDAALPIVDLQQERYWMPDSGKPGGNFLWCFYWSEVLAGWFLASMGIAGVTGLIHKD